MQSFSFNSDIEIVHLAAGNIKPKIQKRCKHLSKENLLKNSKET